MYGALVVAVIIAVVVLAVLHFVDDYTRAKSRRAIDRIHREGRRDKRRLP